MARLRIAALLLALAACSTGGPQPRQTPPGPVVEVPDLELRALLLLLVDRQTWEAYTVDRARAGGPELRRELAVSLGRVGDRRALPTLQELAVDEVPEVRRAAAFALGRLDYGADEDAAAGAARALARALVDADRRTGRMAAEALARQGAELAAVLAAGERLAADELDARLLPALWRFADAGIVPLAERGLARPEPELRTAAAFALTREPRPEAAPAIRRLLGDDEPRIRAWAARALGRVGSARDLQALRPLLADARPGPAIRALDAAARLVAAGRAAPAADWRGPLLALLDAPHRGVRLAATAAAAAWLLDDELGDRLVAMAGAGEPAERRAALLALARGAEPRAERHVVEASLAPAAADRAAAATGAGLLGDRQLARRLLDDPEPLVREAALAVLLEEEPERRAALEAGLADPDPGVRAAVVAWLAATPIAPTIEILPVLDGERWAGGLPELPLGGIRAIVARALAEPAETEAAVFALERYAGGGSHLLRRAAADGLVELGRSRPPVGLMESTRRAVDYQQIVRRTWRPRVVELRTDHGAVRLRLDCREAPLHCLNFLLLAEQGFYDGLTFHRVVPDFVVQGGDPRGDGWGGPGYTIRDEVGPAGFGAGALGMALGGPHTAGSQFFITLAPQPHLDGSFTAFGRVVAGAEVLERIAAGDRILSAAEVAPGRRGAPR